MARPLYNPASFHPAIVRVAPRAVFPYSVIRGGAWSAAELNAALDSDPVAAAHYAGFDRAHIKMTRADWPSRAVYVSFRRDNQVLWTRRTVRIPAGETLLTDGVHTARARCGNRISFVPPEPALAAEPGLDLDIPLPVEAPVEEFAIPRIIQEHFPPELPKWLPPGVVAGTLAADAEFSPGIPGAPLSTGGSAPPGFRFPTSPDLPPFTTPSVWPIDFTTTALGPPVPWYPPVSPPVVLPGNTIPPEPGTLPQPPIWSPPTGPSVAPVPVEPQKPAPPYVPPTTPEGPFSPPNYPPVYPPDYPPDSPPLLPPSPPEPPVTGTPEPSTAALLLAGAAAALLLRRR